MFYHIFRIFQSRDGNKKKSIVEEEIEVELAKENEGFHIKPYYPIILDSGASTTHLASSAVRGPKGKKLKFVTVREEFPATSNIAALISSKYWNFERCLL